MDSIDVEYQDKFRLILFLINAVFGVWTNSPLFRPWLKFLVKVLNWFKGYLMLPKHFRWTV